MSIDVDIDRFGRCAKLAWEHARDIAASADPVVPVTTAHLLLGVAREPTCAGGLILRWMGADLALVEDQAAFVLRYGRRVDGFEPDPVPWEGVAHTPTAGRVLELCIDEADLYYSTFPVGTEHLLLSILRETHSAGARLLNYFDITEPRVRSTRNAIWEVLRLAE